LDAEYSIVAKKVGPSRTAIEFADLLPLAIQILQNSIIARNAVRHTYSDVFLDEFQDCTNLQYQMLKIAFLGTSVRLTAVGDTKQKIMGWAGALDGIFRTFATDFAALPLNMYRNFRSMPRLLRMQNEIIRKLDPGSAMSNEQLAGNDGDIFAWRFNDSASEAEYLADLIGSWLHQEQIPPAEIAILVSKQVDQYAADIMTALNGRGIPFRNEQQLQDITVEPAARLIVDYLSSLYGHREPKAWIRLINQLAPFEDDDDQSTIRKTLTQLIKIHKAKASIIRKSSGGFSGWWSFAQELLSEMSIETLMGLSAEYESYSRLHEVVADTKKRIDELLQLEPDLPKALERFADDRAVRILTIHKSKGLEFDSVIMVAIENEIFFGDQDENRCAYFVGVSRAKRRLILTHADRRDKPAGYNKFWTVDRTPQAEYFGYASPFLNI
jgi:superfamily I DNA/RNA helicase